jgi:hypothetical protein
MPAPQEQLIGRMPFLITNTSNNKAFLGFSSNIGATASDKYNNEYHYLAGKDDRSLHKADVDARNVLSGYTIPIWFCGDRAYKL